MVGSACSGGFTAGLHHDRPCAGPERDPESGMAPCFWKFPATQQSTPLRSYDQARPRMLPQYSSLTSSSISIGRELSG